MTHYPAHSRIYNIKADSLDTLELSTGKQHSVAPSKLINEPNTLQQNSNSLSGLLAHYDSDSEHEDANCQEPNKLDAKVDDFLQEINQIVPGESKQPDAKKQNKHSSAWQECFDESTGYPYYWNMETNAVTWDMPEEYKDWLSRTKETKPPDKVKTDENPKEIDKICVKPTIPDKVKQSLQLNQKRVKPKKIKIRKPSSDSEDEKIVMITSFSEESSSESDTENKENKEKVETTTIIEQPVPMVMGPHVEDIPKDSEVLKKAIIENVKEENIDETVILARLRTQAKVLHELGGELPKSLDKSVIADLPDACKPQSLALVAGYGDDSEPEEEQVVKSLFPLPPDIIETTSESTLFPASVPIDVKQFELPNSKPQIFTTVKETESESIVDNKLFKRKKRLGVAFDVPKIEKRPKIIDSSSVNVASGEERKGFGFQTETNAIEDDKTDKISFVKSGIAFVKADTLNPTQNEQKIDIASSENEEKPEDFDEIKTIVSEKVTFLGEGKDPVSAVQVMAIQLETLELAYKAGGLTRKYLYSWLRETFVNLEKLEQDAAPDGWQCQWDRSNKRYFYRNVGTGEWQWEFPVDIVGGGDAMDICTTPPPNDEDESVPELQPEPPKYMEHSPTPPPPPPPVITMKEKKKKHTEDIQPPIPSAPPPVEVVPPPPPIISVSENQPLPPGVDSPDLPFFASKKDKESSAKSEASAQDSLGSELDSFYSDIAMLDAAPPSTISADTAKSDIENVPSPSSIADSTSSDILGKKKKKSKSKLGQGINMKKKAVSTLVEKWKKVQNDYL